MIDISDIHLIEVVTDVGSINRAAEILHMSQPTLSKKISRLEQKVKMELFVRNSSGMEPTGAAKFLLAESKGLYTQLGIINRHLELMANMIGGQIRIGVGPIVEQLILPKVLLDFAKKSYNFRLVVTTEPPSALLEQLSTSQIDIAIGPFRHNEVKEEFQPILNMSEKLVAIVRQGHPLAKQTHASFEDIKDYHFIAPQLPKKMGKEIINFVKAAEIKPSIHSENYSMAKKVILNSNYITIGPESLFTDEIIDQTLVKLDFPIDIIWQCHCLVKPTTLAMPAVSEVVKLFSKYMDKP